MKTLRRMPHGGAHPVNPKGSSSDDILGSLVSLIREKGEEGLEALKDVLGMSDMDQAMAEFNEKADQMPTARESNMRPGREDLMSLVGKLGDPEKMRSRRARYVPGGSDYKPFVKMMSSEEDRKLNDTVGDRKPIGRTNPNVGEGINPRRRLFRRR
tara:strand:- start:358 stop:825 length:468 start_codon:yes stop_codon:yes gene_type:complete